MRWEVFSRGRRIRQDKPRGALGRDRARPGERPARERGARRRQQLGGSARVGGEASSECEANGKRSESEVGKPRWRTRADENATNGPGAQGKRVSTGIAGSPWRAGPGCFLSHTREAPLFAQQLLYDIGHWGLLVGHRALVIGRWSVVISPDGAILCLDIATRSGVALGHFGSTELAEAGARPGRPGEGAEMSVGGRTQKASQSTVIPVRENVLDLRAHATSPPSEQPTLLDRLRLPIRHQETPEPGFPYRHAPKPFHRSLTTHLLEDSHLSAVPACASPHADRPSTAQAGASRQELLGHRDVSTTMIYTHVVTRGPAAVRSPADRLAILHTPAPPPPAGNRPAEIDCTRLQPIPAASKIRRPTNSSSTKGLRPPGGTDPGEIGCSRLQP